MFGDINLAQQFQVCAGVNRAFSEIWWFYCAANSSTVDRYVVYNYREDIWYYGTMSRTAWIDAGLRKFPIAADYNRHLLYHENGTDDGSTNPPSPIHAFIESSDFDIGDGHNFGFVTRILPDVNFNGSVAASPSVNFGIRPRQYAGSAYGTEEAPTVRSDNTYAMNMQSYAIQRFTPKVDVRLRGRQMAFRVESTGAGVAWQLGTPRFDVRPDGRR